MAVDPNIQQKADYIRTKKKGSEVRESLASGLEAMSEDVVENKNRQNAVEDQFQQVIDETTGKDVISAPEIIAARNNEANLKARLDKEHQQVTAQLDHTAENVDDRGLNIKHFPFLAKGDGVTDDTTALQLALNSGHFLYFPKGTYKITEPLVKVYESNCRWVGNKATISFEPASHREYAIRLQGKGIVFDIDGVNVNGNKMCNKGLEIENNTSRTILGDRSDVYLENLTVERIKRLSSHSGGDAINVRGNFRNVIMEGVTARDCELPLGQGTPGVIGITGIAVNHYGIDSYVEKTIISACEIEKVYSYDLDYTHDQDGIRVFAPHIASGGSFISAEMIVENTTFRNCYGRSIKSQTFINKVTNCRFERDEGLNTKRGNGEVDFQISGGILSGCTYVYKNGFQTTCVNYSSNVGYGNPSLSVRDCEVYLDDSTVLEAFASTFPREGFFGKTDIDTIRVYGSVTEFLRARVNGNKNYFNVKNVFVKEIELSEATNERVLVYATTSGSSSPYHGHITITDCVYGGIHTPAVLRDAISGNSVQTTLNATNNIGFAVRKDVTPNSSGLRETQIARIGRIGPDLTNNMVMTGFFEVQSISIPAGETRVVNVRNIVATMLFINSGSNQSGYAIISSNVNNNTIISKGSLFEIGNNTEPDTGTFRVWSSGQNEITIRNTDRSSRRFSIFEMGSGA
jgi:hypothetical protein